MEKEKYIGKEVIKLSWSGVSDVEYIDQIIDVDELGFTVKRTGILRKTYVGGRDKAWIREKAEGSEGEINFYSHNNEDLHFTFLDSIYVRY